MNAGARPIVYPRDVADELLTRMASRTWATIERQAQDRTTAAMAADNRSRAEIARALPTAAQLTQMLDTAYAASLLEEEARRVVCSFAYLSPIGARSQRFETIEFAAPSPFSASTLRRLAPVLQEGRTQLGVWNSGAELVVWGLIHHGDQTFAIDLKHTPTFLAVRILRPGAFTVHFDERLQMLFSRDHAHFFDRRFDLLGTIRDGAQQTPRTANALCRLARRMLALGHGGTILVVARGETITGLTMNMAFTPTGAPHSVLTAAVQQDEAAGAGELQQQAEESAPSYIRRRMSLEQAHDEALDLVAHLSAVDGAVVIDDRLGLLGFGATIQTPPQAMPDEVVLEDPRIEGSEQRVALAALGGGNRHRSAIAFCAQQDGLALALVASQDGDLSFFARRADGLVHAIRPFELGVGL